MYVKIKIETFVTNAVELWVDCYLAAGGADVRRQFATTHIRGPLNLSISVFALATFLVVLWCFYVFGTITLTTVKAIYSVNTTIIFLYFTQCFSRKVIFMLHINMYQLC